MDAETYNSILEAVLSSLTQPMVIYDQNLRVIRPNSAVQAAFGLDPAFLSQKELNLRLSILGEGIKATEDYKSLCQRALRVEDVRGKEYLFKGPRGKLNDGSFSAVPIMDGGGVKGAVDSWSDLTEKVRAEREQQKAGTR
jgi:PAS domain S-box-containing protein